MNNTEKSTQRKVIIGYTLLVILFISSLFWVFREMMVLSNNDGHNDQLIERRRTTYELISLLHQSEVASMALSAGKESEFEQYNKLMTQIFDSLGALRPRLSDSSQRRRLDTLTVLLERKNHTMQHLLMLSGQKNIIELYNKQIRKLQVEKDSIIRQHRVRRHIITHEHSYVDINPRPKKTFFNRIADLFSTEKDDSVLVTRKESEVAVDTLLETFAPGDTLANLLRDLQSGISATFNRQVALRQEQLNRAQIESVEISRRVNQLLMAFEDEEEKMSQLRVLQAQVIHNEAVQRLAVIAIIALLLVILFMTLTSRDISRSLHYRKALEEAKKRAEDLLELREKLMLTITHDIKAPIGSILGYADLLRRLITEERPRLYLDNMQQSINHLLNLVKSLLDFHKLESNKMEMDAVPFNPKQLFDLIYTSFLPLITKKNIAFEYRVSPLLEHTFSGDPFRIRQITDNLLSNALKFTKEGSITLSVEYLENNLSIRISDTGCGIEQEDHSLLFHEFTRLSNAQGQEGFGLGLAITKRLVNLMQGTITLESEVRRGSVFEVNIPLLQTSSFLSDVPTEENFIQKTDKIYRLLFIDDDPIQLQLTQAMLDFPNIELVCCEDPYTLKRILDEQTFDILFTDIQMPALNGFDLIQKVRSSLKPETRDVAVIAVTARGDISEQTFLKSGFDGCIRKPFTRKELVCVINKFLGSNLIASEMSLSSVELPDNGLSWQGLLAFSNDDAEASLEILTTFIKENKLNIAKMKRALEQNDTITISHIAHKILPTYKLIKCEIAIPLLKELELKKDTTNMTDKNKEKIMRLIGEMQQVSDKAKNVVKNIQGNATK